MPELYILGTVQGLFFCLLLFTKKTRSLADIFLALFILLLSLSLLSAYLTSLDFFVQYPWLAFIDMGIPLLFGPVLWMYAHNLTVEKKYFRLNYILHFIPFVLVYLGFYNFFLLDPVEKLRILTAPIAKIPLKYQIVNILSLISVPVYFLLIMRIISQNNKNIRENYTEIEKVGLKWLKLIAWGFLITWLIVCLSIVIISFSTYALPMGYKFYINMAFVLLIYLIGYFGIKQGNIYINSVVPIDKKIGNSKSLTYMKTTLNQSEYDLDVERLMKIMENERPFIDQELTLSKLADIVGVKPYILSDILNNRLKRSFFDFIHYYRVEEAKKRMTDPECNQFTILAIAYDSGFNSKSSFNRIFKELTALTPSEYKDSQLRQTERKNLYDSGG